MAILSMLLVGGFIALLTTFMLRKSELLPIRLCIGVAGAIVGAAIYGLSTGEFSLLFSWASLLCQVLGAATFVFIFEALHRASIKAADRLHDR